jgi:signal transduction histidine kinase
VTLSGGPNEIAMKIADAGVGFDVQKGRVRGGLGLISMEERVRLLNGTFSIWSDPGKGTHVEVRMPLHP